MRERYGFSEGLCPVSEDLSQRTLALPFFTAIEAEDQERVAQRARGRAGLGRGARGLGLIGLQAARGDPRHLLASVAPQSSTTSTRPATRRRALAGLVVLNFPHALPRSRSPRWPPVHGRSSVLAIALCALTAVPGVVDQDDPTPASWTCDACARGRTRARLRIAAVRRRRAPSATAADPTRPGSSSRRRCSSRCRGSRPRSFSLSALVFPPTSPYTRSPVDPVTAAVHIGHHQGFSGDAVPVPRSPALAPAALERGCGLRTARSSPFSSSTGRSTSFRTSGMSRS